jgi:cGMP-dependent protein kinase
VKVASATAKALALDRDSFEMLLGPLEDIMMQNEQKKAAGNRKSMAVSGKGHGNYKARQSFFPQTKEDVVPDKIERQDLKPLGLLGCGGFGRVTLEEHKPSGRTFALKALSKGYIVKTGMQASVMNEKQILSMTDSDFIIKLHETYKGSQSLYFLLEPCLGGELYATYHRRGFHGSEVHAKFYSCSVICAFEHLHERRVLYRDLKPENVLLDGKGYAKLTDMGLAKFVVGRTYTTCGTPDYFAPEVIASTGHNRAVDWWTLGILIFELMTGHPPFESADPMGTYMKVMQGIEKVRFPNSCKDSIEDLVKNLCKKEPSERIPMRQTGIEGLKKHAWLESFDWKGLIERTVDTPYKPKVKSPTDLANFSAREEDAPRHIKYVDDGSGWDADF